MQVETTGQSSGLSQLTRGVSRGVISAIRSASAKTGVDFAYLVQQAGAESSFNPQAAAKTSSARGLYQFIESTWLDMVDKYGDKHGIKTKGQSRQDLLALRHDPEKASLMAAEFAGENEKFLKTHWGGDIGATERYFAHFLGAGQAAAFLKARDDAPFQAAADLFPKAARANKNVFYERGTGRAKSLDEVYAFFDKKFEAGRDSMPADTSQPNSAVASKTPRVNRPAAPPENFLFSGMSFQDSFNPMQNTTNSLGLFDTLMMNPVDIMLLAQTDLWSGDREDQS